MSIANQPSHLDILIVDDDAINLHLLSNLLKQNEYSVRAIQNPESGLQSAISLPPALILLDIHMPAIDGFEICYRLKQNERTRSIPVIFVSGQNEIADRVRGFEVGGVDFISKPFQREEVLARVRTHLALRQTQQELALHVKERTAALEDNIRHLGEIELAMDRAGIGIYRVDANSGKLLYFNECFCRMHGYTHDELLRMEVKHLNPTLPEKPFSEIGQPVRQAGQGRFESLHRHKLGHDIPVEITLYYYQQISDFPPHFIAFISDISQRKAFEEEMRMHGEHQSTLRSLIEYTLSPETIDNTLEHCLDKILETSWLKQQNTGGIFVTEPDNNRLKLRAARNLPSTDQAATGCYLDQCDFNNNYRMPLITNMQIKGALVIDVPAGFARDEEKVQFLGSVSNILADFISRKEHESRLAEQRYQLEEIIRTRTADLRLSEARTRAIVNTMLDSVIYINPNGIILNVNTAVQDMFGYTEEEMIGNNVSMLMPEPTAANHDGYLLHYMQTRQAHAVGNRREVNARHKNGTVFPIELAVSEMLDDQGTTFIGVVHDLTQQKASNKLAQQALHDAQAAAIAKSHFLANMSHEIRTPLNAVLGMARIGLRDSKDKHSASSFNRILDSGKHLLEVVNDILDFSKIEAGKLRVENRPFLLFPILENVKSFVSAKAEEKGLTLTISMAPNLSEWVTGDSLRLAQILTNLLSNAIKFTDHGEVMLRIAREAENIFIMVVDSGIGMNKAQLSRLFQPFEQADNSTTRNFGGTGLGLVISNELAKLMGGDITVDSSPGNGSTFYLRLPLPAIAAPGNSGYDKPETKTAGTRLNGITVLAADDVQINRLILADLLKHEGAHVAMANDGNEVLFKLEEMGINNVDIVLMDVQMPVMDGLEATRRIKAMTPELPVIGLTAHAMAEEKNKCFNAGMVDHVTKPVDADTLVAAILRQINAKTNKAAASTTINADSAQHEKSAQAHARPFPDICDPGIIDLNILAESVDNDPIRVAKYARMYAESVQDTLHEMKCALAEKDIATVSVLGHRLKPTSMVVGAIRFSEVCMEIESMKDSNDLAAATALVNKAEELFEQISLCIKAAFK